LRQSLKSFSRWFVGEAPNRKAFASARVLPPRTFEAYFTMRKRYLYEFCGHRAVDRPRAA